MLDLLDPRPGRSYLDLGCGEGGCCGRSDGRERAASAAICRERLAAATRRRHRPVAVCRLPEICSCATPSVDGVTTVLVLEHLDEPERLMAEAARVTGREGCSRWWSTIRCYTAPGSAPVVDARDGEVLWRWGHYLERRVSPRNRQASRVDGASTITSSASCSPRPPTPGGAWSAWWSTGWGSAERADEDPLLAAQQRHSPPAGGALGSPGTVDRRLASPARMRGATGDPPYTRYMERKPANVRDPREPRGVSVPRPARRRALRRQGQVAAQAPDELLRERPGDSHQGDGRRRRHRSSGSSPTARWQH